MSNDPSQLEYAYIAVGKQLPFRIPREGACTYFSPTGVMVFINMSDPSPDEKTLLTAQRPPRVGVIDHKGVGFLVLSFGHIYKFGASFDAGFEPPEMLPNFDLPTASSRFGIFMIGVDAVTNVVFGIRGGTLSPRVSREFARLAKSQMAHPISRSQSAALVIDAFVKYPDVTDMIRRAVAFDFLGDDDPAP